MDFDLENPLQNFEDHPSSLFLTESHHILSQTYLHTLKSQDFNFTIRRELISLISELSCTFDPLLSYLAVNYVDRFLSNQGVSQTKPWILRLLAVSCLSLAAKMMRTEYSVSDLQGEGGIIFEARTVGRMESLILGSLQWRMRSITPFSFIPFFIDLFRLKDLPLKQVLKDRATEIIIRSQREIRVLEFKPSIVAASALLSASHELLSSHYPCFLSAISECAYESILKCNNVIQDITMEGYEPALELVSSSETPINVLDHHFLSSESEKTNSSSTTIAASTLRQEKDVKRRKIESGYGNSHTLQISQIK